MMCKKRQTYLPPLATTKHLRQNHRLNVSYRTVRKSAFVLLAMTLTLAIGACGGGASSDLVQIQMDDDSLTLEPSTNDSCDIDVQNQWVYNSMRDYYLFYDQVPQVNPQAYPTSEELLKAIRFEERDPFSFLTDAGSASLQFDEGREFGLGYVWAYDTNDIPRLTRVVAQGPFGKAGLERGDIIISVNEVLWSEVQEDILGSPDAPVTSLWKLEKRDTGEIVELEFTASEYAINTVLHKQYFPNPNDGSTTAYLAFSRFLDTSRGELNAVFQEFNDRNITDLVLDLRYNRGGRVSIAEYLASLIAGSSSAGELLYTYEYNDKYTAKNYSLEFLSDVGELGLTRVIILAQSNTASASEIVISGLQPRMNIVTMGSRTAGKSYIQFGRNRCGRQLNAIEAEGVNAAGVSVFGGITAACYAKDDRTRDFGFDADTGKLEGMLESALNYIASGTCLTEPLLTAKQSLSTPAQHDRAKYLAVEPDDKQGVMQIGGAMR